MYILIIAIHAIFIGVAHFLGYRMFEGIFFFLGIFFLFYFSPLFFLDSDDQKGSKGRLSPKNILSQLSPKNSLLVPVILLYIAIYGFLIALFRIETNVLLYHAIIVTVIYLIFFAYSLVFFWKNDVFFELLRFHTLFTIISSIIFTISLILDASQIHFLHSTIGFVGLIAGTFLLSYTRQESVVFLWSYLSGMFATLIMFLLWIFPSVGLVEVCALCIGLSILIFEFFPKISLFSSYTASFRYFALIALLLFLLPVFYIAFDTVDSLAITILAITAAFFLSIHRRYTNYVVYIIAILEIFFIYALVFVGLLHQDLMSLFLFLFFLSILLIGVTYFWEEEHLYDFTILHYSAIGFSIIYSLYSIFFLSWGGDILFVISLTIFGIAILFFLSYFRLRPSKKSLIH